MKDIKHDGSARLNRLGPACVPNGYSFPSFPFFSLPIIPLFSYFHMPILSFPL
jgi:hypothetical protein